MPMVNGYSIYVGGGTLAPNGWVVRVYRDADDTHIHSAEGASLDVGLAEARRAILADVNAPREADPHPEMVGGPGCLGTP